MGNYLDGSSMPINAQPIPVGPPPASVLGFQLPAPFSGGPAPGMPSLFPEYQPPTPTYQPPPEQVARANAWDAMSAASLGAMSDPLGMAAPPAQAAPAPGMDAPAGMPQMGLDPRQREAELLRINQSTGTYDERKALIGAGQKFDALDLERTKQGAQDDTKQFYDAAIDKGLDISKARTAEFQAMQPTDLWGKSDGGKREALLAVMVLGGILDAATGNNNHPIAMNTLRFAMQKNREEDAARAEAAIRKVKVADANVEQLKLQRAAALTDIEHKSAAQWKVIQAEAEAQIAAMAPGQMRDAAAKNAVLISQAAEEQTQKAEQAAANLAARGVATQLANRRLQGGGAAGPGKMKEATAGEIAGLQKAETDIKAIDQLETLIRENPQAWMEYRNNNEDWRRKEEASKSGVTNTLRRGFQGLGVADIAEEQGLRTSEGKQIHQKMNKLLTSIAKGYGGAITGGDIERSGAELSALANSPDEMAGLLGNMRNTLTSGRDLVLSNRRVNMPQSSASVPITPGNAAPAGIRPTPAAATPQGLPPGAEPGTYQGRRGYKIGSDFVFTE